MNQTNMGFETPATGRAQITDSGNSLIISIPSKKSIIPIIFLCVWLAGWAFAERTVFKQLTKPDHPTNEPFIYIWFVGWSIGGVCALGVLLWLLKGKEIITFSSTTIKVERTLFGIGRKQQYDTSQIKKLRAAPDLAPSNFLFRTNYPLMGTGKIAFDYGMKTVRIACDVDEAEGTYLLEQIQKRFHIKE